LIGGSVSGLNGGTLTLQNNGGNNLNIAANGSFNFPTAVPTGTAYAITVSSQPAGQRCTVASLGASGTVGTSAVNSVSVSCVALFTVGGSVFGLNGGTLTLQNNGSDSLDITANGPFNFPTAVLTGAAFAVTISAQPNATGQSCVITDGSGVSINAGTINNGSVNNINVYCVVSPASSAGYGNQRVLVAHLMFSDTATPPFPTSDTQARTAKIGEFFNEISYGTSKFTFNIQPWAALPNSQASYQADPTGGTLTAAAISYVRSNYDLSNTDMVMILLTPIAQGFPGCYEERGTVQVAGVNQNMPFAILSGQGASGTACNQNTSIMSHELGHALGGFGNPVGFLHSSMFACMTWPKAMPQALTDPTYSAVDCGIGAPTPDPNAIFYPYAYYDFMGSYRGHPSSYWKQQAGWISAAQVKQVSGTASVALDPYEVPTAGTKAVQIPLGVDEAGGHVAYWVEYRSRVPTDLESPTTVTPEGFADTVKVWINLPNVPGTGVQEGNSLVGQSQVFTFWQFTNGPANTDVSSGGTYLDPYRGIQVARSANTQSGGLTVANVTVSTSALQLSVPIGVNLSSATPSQNVVVTNRGSVAVSQGALVLQGRNPGSFSISSDTCSNHSLAPNQSCTVQVLHSRAGGDTSTYFAEVEWTSNDPIRPTPSFGMVGVP
jgi:hypothetical protein